MIICNLGGFYAGFYNVQNDQRDEEKREGSSHPLAQKKRHNFTPLRRPSCHRRAPSHPPASTPQSTQRAQESALPGEWQRGDVVDNLLGALGTKREDLSN